MLNASLATELSKLNISFLNSENDLGGFKIYLINAIIWIEFEKFSEKISGNCKTHKIIQNKFTDICTHQIHTQNKKEHLNISKNDI